MSGKDGVVIVVRVLPLVIRKESNGQWFVKWNDEDLNVATELGYSLSSVKQMSQNDDGNSSPRHLGAVKMRVQWVGMPRISTTQSARMDATISMQDRMELQDILSNFGCIPVWASSEIMRCHHVFCTEILRPVIHNVYDPYVVSVRVRSARISIISHSLVTPTLDDCDVTPTLDDCDVTPTLDDCDVTPTLSNTGTANFLPDCGRRRITRKYGEHTRQCATSSRKLLWQYIMRVT